jgi:hypothetical protein
VTDVGKVEVSPARRPNPYMELQQQVCGCGTVGSRLLFAMAIAGPCIFLVFGLLAGLHGALVALLVLLPTTAVVAALRGPPWTCSGGSIVTRRPTGAAKSAGRCRATKPGHGHGSRVIPGALFRTGPGRP